MAHNSGETGALRKPVFVKVADLESGRSGYNVFVQVVSCDERIYDTKDGQKIRMVDAVVADETGCSKAFFKAEHAKDIKKDAIIAMRNGVRKIIKGHISLELDLFGRVTLENQKINPNADNNISNIEIKLDPRMDRQRRPRNQNRGNQGHRINRDRGQRRDRIVRNGGERNQRPPRGNYEEEGYRKENRRERGEQRQERREWGERRGRAPVERRDQARGPVERRDRDPVERRDRGPVERRDRGQVERRDRGQVERRDRGPAERRDREPAERRDREPAERRGQREWNEDRDYDRRNNRGEGGNRVFKEKPRDENRVMETRGDRKPMVKINEIKPGEENIKFIAKIISAKLVPGRNGDSIRCVLGDETGIVNGFLAESEHLAVGKTCAFFGAEARVVNEHIEIQKARVEPCKNPIDQVHDSFNLSSRAWVPVD